MLIVNYNRLNVAEALPNDSHPMHVYAKEYDAKLKELNKKYPDGILTFMPATEMETVDIIDSGGHETHGVPLEPVPIRIPLSAHVSDPKRGKEYWGVCLGNPYQVREGVWDIGSKLDTKSKQVKGSFNVNIKEDPDLAFFMAFKSRLVTGGHWKIADPKGDIKKQGDVEREQLARKLAIWQTLQDEEQLRMVAAGWGIEKVKEKETDAIRFEIEALLEKNDKLKLSDPSYKGTTEFMEDLKINDYIRLSAFIRHFLDASLIDWRKDGRYKIGDKTIAHVPADHVNRRFEWLCNYFASPNKADELKELMHDLVNKDYLDTLAEDSKDFRWLAKVMDITGYFNKSQEEVRTMVYSTFVL